MKPDPINPIGEEQAQRVAWLVAGYLRQTLNDAEHDELDDWITASDANQLLFEELTDPDFVERGLKEFEQTDRNTALERIRKKLHFTTPERNRNRRRVWISRVAASILLLTALFFAYTIMKPKTRSKKEVVEINNIQTGGNYAVLSLGNGKSIILQDVKNGLIDSTGNSEVLKTADGQLSYENSLATPDIYHTLSTPTGGQYCVLLQDGSRVWLNASSSLRYPTVFSGEERVVELKGEGYFEVVPSSSAMEKKAPFIVKVDGMEVNVLGTHFNINAYRDEPFVTTTLLEGSVNVAGNNSAETRQLKPGEQAKFGTDGGLQVIAAVDTDEIVAWKNGQFKFNDAPIEYVMRQVSRWYGAEIVYEGKVNYHFNATIHRHEPVKKLLGLLEETDRVHFTIQDKKIIVKP